MELKKCRQSLLTLCTCTISFGFIFQFKGFVFYTCIFLTILSLIAYIIVYIRDKNK